MLNECFLSPSLVCQVVERLCQGEGRCTVAVTSHQGHCADRCGAMVEYEDMSAMFGHAVDLQLVKLVKSQ